MFGGFSHSVIGASHETSGLVCQDHSAYEVNEHYSVAVIADGHGSKKYFRSHLGSQFAVESALETLRHFYADPEGFEQNFPKNHKMILKNMKKQIIANWNAHVQEHLANNPVRLAEMQKFTKEEFKEIPPESYYGTTLVVAVCGRGFQFGLQIGDGSLVAIYEDGVPVMPMVYDESAPANMTASMCNSNAASMFNSFYVENKKAIAMYASSDGLYTSFSNEDDFLEYHLIITSQLDNLEAFAQSVKKNLTKRSHYGTEDDISLACICDLDLLQEKVPMLKAEVADRKAHAAERKAQRLAALRNT
ncbi:MAG: protein phosphatase 2C domain-containing protein [Oscillospiraceae bacterium]|nr:protein phosphatase 2C domain-containing protein [Oscillospiraceae bacterium]